ncbi:MAG: hypothetical protein ACYS76_13565 [Planctomycetota bacterium]
MDPLIEVGWKTSLNHFNDAAVWWDSINGQWAPMSDPCTGRPLRRRQTHHRRSVFLRRHRR